MLTVILVGEGLFPLTGKVTGRQCLIVWTVVLVRMDGELCGVF